MEIMPDTLTSKGNDEQLMLPEMHGLEQDYHYQLLTEHKRTDGSIKSSDQLKTEYVRLTDNLVNTITNGVNVLNPNTGETERKPIDFIVWLDKSARPVSWLTKELWPQLGVDEEGNDVTMPAFRFVNIDREQWTSEVDPNNVGKTYVDELSPTIIRSLRSIFLSNPSDRPDSLDESIDDAPTQFDGKTVMIIDEVRSSGRTLDYATSFFKRAFPEGSFVGDYWMSGMTTKGEAVGNADIPVWYSDETSKGRGVNNRNIDLSLKSKNRTQRLGARFLSTAFKDDDPLSVQLREEFHQLSIDLHVGKVLYEPSWERDEVDYFKRALKINGLSSEEEYLKILNTHKESK